MNENKKGVRAPKRTQKAKGLEIAASKPRNFVAKNAKTAGAGAHKDKAKTIPRKAKHKKAEVAESLETRLARALQEVAINEEGLSPMKRLQIIRFIANEKGWGISDLELASDSELIHMYKKIKAGEDVAEGGDELDQYDLDQLQGYYSDFNKDLLGFRPRGASEEEWNDPKWLKAQINKLHDYFDRLKSTPEGRAQLKADGWKIDEPKNEGWTTDTLAAKLFEQDHTYEDRLTRMLAGKVAFMEGNEPVIMMSKDEGHGMDHEVKMAREEAYHAAKVSFELYKLLQNIEEAEGLPGWVSEKISLAYDYLKTVQEYLDYEHKESPKEVGDTGDE